MCGIVGFYRTPKCRCPHWRSYLSSRIPWVFCRYYIALTKNLRSYIAWKRCGLAEAVEYLMCKPLASDIPLCGQRTALKWAQRPPLHLLWQSNCRRTQRHHRGTLPNSVSSLRLRGTNSAAIPCWSRFSPYWREAYRAAFAMLLPRHARKL